MPVALKQLHMDDDLTAYLQAIPIFSLSESELERNGFARCVDHPEVPKHIYYEGYFHGLASPSPVRSINPRKGHSMDKPACDKRFRAFIIALKRLNNAWIQNCLSGADEASRFFRSLAREKDWHFADIAVQVHAGDEINGKHIGWHNDAPNSTLHLAVSIRGRRALHSRLADKIRDEEMKLQRHEQVTGDVYVSSPFAFPHGVEYSEAKTWEERIVAVQCRFLLDEETYFKMRDTYQSLESLMDRLTNKLQECTVVLPTLQQVKDVEAELQEADPYVPPAQTEQESKLELYSKPPASNEEGKGAGAQPVEVNQGGPQPKEAAKAEPGLQADQGGTQPKEAAKSPGAAEE